MRTLSSRITVAVAATALTMGLAACTPRDEDPGATASAPEPGPAPTVTVTVTAEPETVTEPDFGFTFFHEAQLGQTFAQAGVALHMPVAGIMDCPYYGPLWNTELATTYGFTDSMNPGSGITMFYAQQFLGTPGDPWPRNAEGVGLGSTQAEILAAYPDAVVESVNDLGAGDITRILVEDPESDSRYAFGITSGASTVDLLQWGPDAGGQWSHLCGGF